VVLKTSWWKRNNWWEHLNPSRAKADCHSEKCRTAISMPTNWGPPLIRASIVSLREGGGEFSELRHSREDLTVFEAMDTQCGAALADDGTETSGRTIGATLLEGRERDEPVRNEREEKPVGITCHLHRKLDK